MDQESRDTTSLNPPWWKFAERSVIVKTPTGDQED